MTIVVLLKDMQNTLYMEDKTTIMKTWKHYKKPLIYYIYISMLLFLITIFITLHKQDELIFGHTVRNTNERYKTANNDKNILDGCYHVYLDIGSNIGVQIRKLFEPERLWHASIHRVFNTNFGNIKQ